VENAIKITQFSAGVDISMAVSTEGEVFGWGKGKGGRIGLGLSDVDVLLPRRVPLNDMKAVDVECGYLHSVIVGLDGSIFMCGRMLGDEASSSQQQDTVQKIGYPVQVSNFNVWQGVPEPSKVNVSAERWKKYGKYELQGRSKVMAESARWGA
jgi:alpha-tubulin suppressor-like RCC1 family protein